MFFFHLLHSKRFNLSLAQWRGPSQISLKLTGHHLFLLLGLPERRDLDHGCAAKARVTFKQHKASYVVLVRNADGGESLIKDPCSTSVQGKAGVGTFPTQGSPIDWLALICQSQARQDLFPRMPGKTLLGVWHMSTHCTDGE